MGIAVLLWLLTKLSNEYTGNISAEIEYINLPDNLVPTKPLQKNVILLVEATGFRLLGKNLFGGVEKVVLNYELYNNEEFIPSNDYQADLINNLDNTFIVRDVKPDTIYFSFEEKMTVKVPVILNSNFTFASQHDLMEPVIFEPDSVTVSGPFSIVDSIFNWPTAPLEFLELKESRQGEVGMMEPLDFAVEIVPEQVRYTVPVEKYTELSTKVDVTTLNIPDSLDIIIYPKSVDVTFRVGISNYEVVQPDDFEATVDFAGLDLFNNQYVDIELTRAPPYIKNINITPKQVEYIIYKR